MLDNSMKTQTLIANKTSNRISWRDQGKVDIPVYETIARSEIEQAIRPRDVTKVTAHKRYPSNKIKPIIKYTNNLIGKCLHSALLLVLYSLC